MVRLLGGVLALGLTVALATAAVAQEDEWLRCTVRVGTYIPTDGNVTANLGSTWWNIDISQDLRSGETSTERVAIGWIVAPGKRLQTAAGSAKSEFRMVPLTYTYLRRPGGPARALYYGGGVGVYLGSNGTRTAVGEAKQTEAWLGFHVIGGYALNRYMGVEARYTHVFDNLRDASVNGFAVAATGRY